jgi:flagellar protein FlaF
VNALDMAKRAYVTHAAPIRTHRGTEYEAISRVTRALVAARDAGPTGFARLVQALHENRRLWTTLAVSVADRENRLPADLRARIVYLAQFSMMHGSRVLRREASADALIEINTAVMRGLSGGGPR